MKVIVEAINAPSLYLEPGTTAKLRIEAIKGFTTFDGQFVPPSNGNKLYLEVPISITANVPLIPSFEIDSTEDSMPWDSAIIGDVPGYRFTIVTSRGKKIPYFLQCKVRELSANETSLTWGELRIFNRTFHRRFTALDRMVNEDQVRTWIDDALGSRGYASETNRGVTALSYDPAAPNFPIAVSVTDPLWVSLSGGSGGLVNSGVANMVDGAVEVANGNVAAGSIIGAFSRTPNVSGSLYVDPAEIVDGVSFVIRSNQVGDQGEVGWMF